MVPRDRPLPSFGFHIRRVAGIAGRAQLPDQFPELVAVLSAAGIESELRGRPRALIEIRKILPHVGRCERIGCRIAIDIRPPLVGGRGNICGNDISMIDIVSACSTASAASTLPPGASMVSISSMFMSIAPIRILRAKIVSFGGGRACSWAAAAKLAASIPARSARRAPKAALTRDPAFPGRGGLR